MIKRNFLYFKDLFLADVHQPTILAKSVALGIYIAFCPFIGLHTILALLCAWIFSLSIPIVFMVCLLLHNPWTIVFVYGAGYFCGSLFCYYFNIEHTFLDTYLTKLLQYIPYLEHIPYIQMSPTVCMKFLVGGNLLGVGAALLFYPFVKQYAIRYNEKQKKL